MAADQFAAGERDQRQGRGRTPAGRSARLRDQLMATAAAASPTPISRQGGGAWPARRRRPWRWRWRRPPGRKPAAAASTRKRPMASPAQSRQPVARVAMDQIAGREGQGDVDQEGGIGRPAIEIDAREMVEDHLEARGVAAERIEEGDEAEDEEEPELAGEAGARRQRRARGKGAPGSCRRTGSSSPGRSRFLPTGCASRDPSNRRSSAGSRRRCRRGSSPGSPAAATPWPPRRSRRRAGSRWRGTASSGRPARPEEPPPSRPMDQQQAEARLEIGEGLRRAPDPLRCERDERQSAEEGDLVAPDDHHRGAEREQHAVAVGAAVHAPLPAARRRAGRSRS